MNLLDTLAAPLLRRPVLALPCPRCGTGIPAEEWSLHKDLCQQKNAPARVTPDEG